MNGAKHRIALGLTCFLMVCLTVIYPFLLYTPNAFVTRWREWYIETAMGTMTHQWLATWFIPSDIIEEVMSKRYVMNQKQSGVFSSWFDELELEEPAEGTPKEQFYHIFSELDRDSFEAFLRDNPEYIADGYDHIDIDLIGDDMTRKNYDTGIRTTQGDTVLAINAEHGIMIVEIVGEDSLGMEYAGKLALCKQPKNVFVGTCEGLFEYGSYVTEMVDRYDAKLGINASGFADYEGNGTGGLPYGFLKSEGEELQPDKSEFLIDITVDAYIPERYIAEAAGVDRIAAWTYRGGYGTVVGAPDALKLWDTIGETYRRLLKK